MQKRSRYWTLVGITVFALVVMVLLRVPMLAALGIIVAIYATIFVVNLVREDGKRR